MKTTKPDFFDDFCCLAQNCKHNCCKEGWQIDIDAKTLQKYEQSQNKIFADVSQKIVQDGNGGHCIKLDKDKKCPYLLDDGLCGIAVHCGNKFLSDVCRDYPRFYNFLPDKTEVGLGLGCEEVARIVLSHKEKITFVSDSKAKSKFGTEDKNFQQICETFQNRNFSFFERVKQVALSQKIDLDKIFAVTKNFEKFEWLNFDFSKYDYSNFCIKELQCLQNFQAENLSVNFLYRYFSNKKYRFLPQTKVAFAIFGTMFVDEFLSQNHMDSTQENQIFVTTNFSKEFEYSFENMTKALDFLQKTATKQ